MSLPQKTFFELPFQFVVNIFSGTQHTSVSIRKRDGNGTQLIRFSSKFLQAVDLEQSRDGALVLAVGGNPGFASFDEYKQKMPLLMQTIFEYLKGNGSIAFELTYKEFIQKTAFYIYGSGLASEASKNIVQNVFFIDVDPAEKQIYMAADTEANAHVSQSEQYIDINIIAGTGSNVTCKINEDNYLRIDGIGAYNEGFKGTWQRLALLAAHKLMSWQKSADALEVAPEDYLFYNLLDTFWRKELAIPLVIKDYMRNDFIGQRLTAAGKDQFNAALQRFAHLFIEVFNIRDFISPAASHIMNVFVTEIVDEITHAICLMQPHIQKGASIALQLQGIIFEHALIKSEVKKQLLVFANSLSRSISFVESIDPTAPACLKITAADVIEIEGDIQLEHKSRAHLSHYKSVTDSVSVEVGAAVAISRDLLLAVANEEQSSPIFHVINEKLKSAIYDYWRKQIDIDPDASFSISEHVLPLINQFPWQEPMSMEVLGAMIPAIHLEELLTDHKQIDRTTMKIVNAVAEQVADRLWLAINKVIAAQKQLDISKPIRITPEGGLFKSKYIYALARQRLLEKQPALKTLLDADRLSFYKLPDGNMADLIFVKAQKDHLATQAHVHGRAALKTQGDTRQYSSETNNTMSSEEGLIRVQHR